MKRLLIAVAVGGLLLAGVVIGRAATVTPDPSGSTVKTYQSGAGEHQYVIPPSGSYCFNADSNLPSDLPVCGVNPHQAVAPNPNIGPKLVCEPGYIAIDVAPWCARPAGG